MFTTEITIAVVETISTRASKEVRKRLFFLSQKTLGTEKKLTKINVRRYDRITGNSMLFRETSKSLLLRVTTFGRSVGSVMTSEGGKSRALKERINTSDRIKEMMIKSAIDGSRIKGKGEIKIKIRRNV